MDRKAGEPCPDPLNHGDYVYTGRGEEIRLVKRKTCSYGHPTAQTGWGQCPRCRKYTTMFNCADLRCDGDVTSYAHESVCPV